MLTLASLHGAAEVHTAPPPLMPLPKVVSLRGVSVLLDEHFRIAVYGPGAADARVQTAISRTLDRVARQTGLILAPQGEGVARPATVQIFVTAADHAGPQRLGDDESYTLATGEGFIRLQAHHPIGVLRGLETFLQLIQSNPAAQNPGFYVPGVIVRDEPRFPWRGLSLDCSRHFISVGELKRTIDGMAAVKLNVLHWHLTDDEGFRIESKRFPRLQSLGSDGLFYSQDDVREIILYARNRGIRVVPEFDMPGHSMSWFPGYPMLAVGQSPYHIQRLPTPATAVMDPTKESTYRFLDDFLREMVKLFPDQYVHIGGDEVNAQIWDTTPRIVAFMKQHNLENGKALQGYFLHRVTELVMKHGKRVIGWDDVLQPGAPKTMVVESYRGQKSMADAAMQGYDAVLSTGYYLDLIYPTSEHYLVDPGRGDHAALSPQAEKHVLGGEAAMWEEIATDENLDAKLWPRLAAIAERFWSPATVNDVPSMYARLEVINRWLEWLDLRQRTNLELMRQRLAGNLSAAPLEAFSSILEPVKNFGRQPNYGSWTPLNHLADAIPPESDAARHFRNAVSDYLDGRNQVDVHSLRTDLQRWQNAAVQVRPLLESNSLMKEDLNTASALEQLCQAGIEALGALSSGQAKDQQWVQHATAAVEDGLKPHAETVIAIAPAVDKLVKAVPVR